MSDSLPLWPSWYFTGLTLESQILSIDILLGILYVSDSEKEPSYEEGNIWSDNYVISCDFRYGHGGFRFHSDNSVWH